jgi:hypothetical protein
MISSGVRKSSSVLDCACYDGAFSDSALFDGAFRCAFGCAFGCAGAGGGYAIGARAGGADVKLANESEPEVALY